jgi:hypothetical protein
MTWVVAALLFDHQAQAVVTAKYRNAQSRSGELSRETGRCGLATRKAATATTRAATQWEGLGAE